MNLSELTNALGGESPARLQIRLPLAERELSAEASHEFTLPDYLPEIKRMLRATLSVEPPESYVGASDAEFSGRLVYHLLYVGADDALHACELPAEYALSCPIDEGEKCNRSMGTDAFAHVTPDLLVTRVLSPRRVNLRARMRAVARVYGYHSLAETLSGSPHGRIERLTGGCDCATVLCGYTRGAVFSDEMIADASMKDSRVAMTEGRVFVTEAIPDDGRVTLRGEILVKLLLAPLAEDSYGEIGGDPSVTQRRIPFSVDVPVEGCDRYFDCRGFGVPTRIATTEEDGRVIVDVECTFSAEGQKNAPFYYTRDLFSTGADCETVYGEETLPFALSAENGNFTFSDSLPLEKAGLSESDRIVDVTGELTPTETTEKDGKTVIGGEGHFHLVVRKADTNEYAPIDVTLPFRYTADGARSERRDLPEMRECIGTFDAISARARQDGQRLSIDAEVAVSYRTMGKTKIRLLESASFGAPVREEKGCVVLAYPSPTDTLWEIARRYRVPVEALARKNGVEPLPDSPVKGARLLVARS